MLNRKTLFVMFVLLLTAVVTVAVFPYPNARAARSSQEAVSQLTSLFVEEAPTLDEIADEDAWADAEAVEIPVAGGANNGETTVELKSVYTEDMVFFVATWEDPTESFLRSPWEMQADGSWAQLTDPDDRGGDNKLWYEDKLSFIWPIDNSIPNFEQLGCFTACHAGENSDVKPYGNMYTAEEGQLGDIWHWKSVRNLNQVHDQYLDHARYSEEAEDAGRHGDPKDPAVMSITRPKMGPCPRLCLAPTIFRRMGARALFSTVRRSPSIRRSSRSVIACPAL